MMGLNVPCQVGRQANEQFSNSSSLQDNSASHSRMKSFLCTTTTSTALLVSKQLLTQNLFNQSFFLLCAGKNFHLHDVCCHWSPHQYLYIMFSFIYESKTTRIWWKRKHEAGLEATRSCHFVLVPCLSPAPPAPGRHPSVPETLDRIAAWTFPFKWDP